MARGAQHGHGAEADAAGRLRRAVRLSVPALLVACNAILDIGGDYHRVPAAAAGAGPAGQGGAPAGGMGGASAGSAGVGVGTGGTIGDSGSSGDAGDGSSGIDGSGGTLAGSDSTNAGDGGVSVGGAGRSSSGGRGGRGGRGGGTAGSGEPGCGNGVTETALEEECDDGGVESGDGCDADCALEAGMWQCDNGAGFNSPTICRRPWPSCAEMTGTECNGGDCCASLVVDGGTFVQGPDPSDGSTFESTVSTFLLDRYEVTVSRFHAFVSHYSQWHGTDLNPKPGDGENPNIAGSGWDAAWDATLGAGAQALRTEAQCSSMYETWESVTASAEVTRPINCLTWSTAFAFCIWDGGRLPTEAEWEFAASSGGLDYTYPWNMPPLDHSPDTAEFASYACLGDGSAADTCVTEDILDVGASPSGRSVFGHDDLIGSMDEWTLDELATYPTGPSTDHATLGNGARAVRGGNWAEAERTAQYRTSANPTERSELMGFRCARNP